MHPFTSETRCLLNGIPSWSVGFFFSCQNAKSRACSLVGGRPPTDRVQVAGAAHIRTLSEGRLTRKIGSAPPDLLHFQIFCISFQFFAFLASDKLISGNLVTASILSAPRCRVHQQLVLTPKCFSLLSDRENLKCPHFFPSRSSAKIKRRILVESRRCLLGMYETNMTCFKD